MDRSPRAVVTNRRTASPQMCAALGASAFAVFLSEDVSLDRDPSIFREAALLLSRDLERALPVPGGWRISVFDDFSASVTAGGRSESLELSDVVDDPGWFDVGENPEERREVLVAEASEALYDEMLDRMVGIPRCRIHDAPLGVCSGVWFCSASHDVCEVGGLTSDKVVVR